MKGLKRSALLGLLTTISIILLLATLFSCSPFIDKELRRKNKCNRKLERVVTKCPELLNPDTIKQIVKVEVPKVEIDSFIVIQRDTSILELIKNDTIKNIVRHYINNYKPLEDTITHIIDGYTFKFYSVNDGIGYSVDKPKEVIEEEIEIPIDVVKPIQLTIFEQIMNGFSRFWWWLVLGFILFVGYRIVFKK